MKKIPKNILTKWLLILSSTLVFVHQNKVYHRDIKPNNILVFGEDITKLETLILKFTDFGVGRMNDETKSVRTVAGTKGFMAPELLKRIG